MFLRSDAQYIVIFWELQRNNSLQAWKFMILDLLLATKINNSLIKFIMARVVCLKI